MSAASAPLRTPGTRARLGAPWRSEWLFTIKVARPGFWTTSIWFYLLPLRQRHVFGTWTFWLGLFYVTFPMGLLIYGWNDLADAFLPACGWNVAAVGSMGWVWYTATLTRPFLP